MYKVTLSMPIYNVAPYVERALLSALNQTFESIEFLLVDDRGTDSSMDIVHRIIKDHPRGKDVRIIEHPHNIGLGAARNTAIDNAQGKYLFFMDSDDEITLDCIEILYNRMMEEKVDFVCGSFIEMSIDKVALRKNRYRRIILNTKRSLIEYLKTNTNAIPIVTWNKLYDKSFLNKNNIRCIPSHYSEDQIFTFLVLCNAKTCSFCDNYTYDYYQNINSLSGNLRLKGCSFKMANEFNDILKYRSN